MVTRALVWIGAWASVVAGCGAGATPDGGPRATASSSTKPAPKIEKAARRSRALFVGGQSACAIRAGVPYCWGDNDRQLLAKDAAGPQPIPVRAPYPLGASNDAKALSVSIGTFGPAQLYSLVLLDSGVVQRFNGEKRIDVPELGEAVDVAVSKLVACALSPAGKVTCAEMAGSQREPVESPRIDDAIAIEGGGGFCAITGQGKVVCWGYMPTSDRLAMSSAFFATREVLGSPSEVVGLEDARQISVGEAHACALRKAGSVVCWGRGGEGRLGGITAQDSPEPVAVTLPEPAIRVAAGATHSCAILQSKKVFCWGRYERGADRASAMIDVEHARDIEAGSNLTCAELDSGEVKCWGDNEHGQLGNGTLVDDPSPQPVADMKDATQLALGDSFSCAQDAALELRCWGGARQGERAVPPRVVPDAQGAKSFVADDTLLALFKDGGFQDFDGTYEKKPHAILHMPKSDLAALADPAMKIAVLKKGGRAAFIRFGLYNDKPKLESNPIPGLDKVVDLVRGMKWACGLRANGTVGCVRYSPWEPPKKDHLPPVVEVTGLTDAVSLGAGAWRGMGVCAVRKTGGVVCIEEKGAGEQAALSAVSVAGLDSGVVQLTRGRSDAICARRDSGAVVCWGRNDSGQLGTGDYEHSDRPRPVVGVTDAVFVATGRSHTCAARKRGDVVCWGSDATDQLGRRESSHPRGPVRVKLPD